MTNESHASYYYTMNTIGIFLYIISVIMWWAGFNYAAARASTARRRKLLSTAATLALAWPFAFIALAAALATKAAANIMIAVGDHINNTWDAAVSDEGDTTTVTKPTPTCTAMRVRHENTEHDTSAANGDHEGGETATNTETRPAFADNTPLMPPPPPPATDADDHDGLDQANTSGDETAQATANDTDMDDETVTIQKVTLSDLI